MKDKRYSTFLKKENSLEMSRTVLPRLRCSLRKTGRMTVAGNSFAQIEYPHMAAIPFRLLQTMIIMIEKQVPMMN